MKTKHFLLTALCWLACLHAYAQGENNIWAFGDSTGLDFSGGDPVQTATHNLTFESGGTMCSADGRLLFYCGTTADFRSCCLRDATHSLMPNGEGLLSNKGTSSMQGVAIVPFLDGSNRYYVFIQAAMEDIWAGDHYLRYSVVDMDLHGGLGDVVPGQKNIIIDSFVSEKLGVSRGASCSVWLINHRSDTNVFHAFKVDMSGLHAPVASGFASGRSFSFSYPTVPIYLGGTMDVSQDGTSIVAVQWGPPSLIELYDFDNSTGLVSHQRIIDSASPTYVHFSPDGSKLYTGPVPVQYDLSLLPSLSAVKASRYQLSDTAVFWDMRTGPDKKIYAPYSWHRGFDVEQNIWRINDPDKTGAACGLTKYLSLGGVLFQSLGFGLENVVPVPGDTLTRLIKISCCFTPSATLKADSGFSWYLWNDGARTRTREVKAPGKAWVSMRKGCNWYTDTFEYSAAPLDSAIFSTDTSICFMHPLTVKVSAKNFLRWNDGDTATVKTITSEGTFWYISFPSACMVRIDSIQVHHKGYDTSITLQTAVICPGSLLTLGARGRQDSYSWDDGSRDSSRSVTKPGLYWVSSITGCAVQLDTFTVQAGKQDTTRYVQDTTICFASQHTVRAMPGFTSYYWSDGKTGAFNTFKSSGTKWLLSTSNECAVRVDTFHIHLVDFSTSLPAADSFCKGQFLILDATTERASYLWQDGHKEAIDTASTPGTYTVAITVDGCTRSSSSVISSKELIADLGADQTVCMGEVLILNAPTGMDTYLWNDGSTDQHLQVQAEGLYTVRIRSGICEAADTVQVSIVRCSNCIHIPSAFTPDNDGRNDYFSPLLHCAVQQYELKIFNRYGQEIFRTDNPAKAWDGTVSGKVQELGVYYYLLRIRFNIPAAEEEHYKGYITLIR